MRRLFLILAAAILPGQALAANQVALDNSVFVERVTTDANGKQRVKLEEPKVVVPGDKLVFVLNYRNASAQPVDKFVITNPLPDAVRYADAGDSRPLVSVDGGKAWGLLTDLTVRQPDGTTRPAQPADVTHIRWAFQQPIPAGASGKLMFRGIVK
ncbi:MAG TPA: hypothetical protein PKD99_08745 [Sphingopyxis sp.]|nr:hypothetical protein [Sphingopyxis sp.]HMP45177.1 hypothetical protein [Sphingopyxis sp.]HMQ17786.1 hypothetical protein [Sphingopyxis sp.]